MQGLPTGRIIAPGQATQGTGEAGADSGLVAYLHHLHAPQEGMGGVPVRPHALLREVCEAYGPEQDMLLLQQGHFKQLPHILLIGIRTAILAGDETYETYMFSTDHSVMGNALLGCAWRAAGPWSGWSRAWRGWRTNWCPRRVPPGRLRLPPEVPAPQHSGT